ncbi:MAG: SpoIIE family protein phosphatase [Spirochaetes bacterium]|nr:SpoIIE family protein phosphatase [Spirochaetota bacterium]
MELVFASDTDKKLSSLMTIIKRINSTVNLDETLSLIMAEAKAIMKSEASSLMLIDNVTNELFFNTTTGEKGDIIKEIRFPLSVGIAGAVATTGESIIINDEADPRIYRAVDDKAKFVTRNLIAVPLIAKNKTLGVLEVLNKFEGIYSDEDMALLIGFADFAALAINNRELYKSMQDKAMEVSALYQISQSINHFDSLEDLLKDNLSVVSETLEAKRVSIIVKDRGAFVFKAGCGIADEVLKSGVVTVQDNALAFALAHNTGVVCQDVNNDDRFPANKKLRYDRRSFVVAPLRVKGAIVGFVSVTERYTDIPYQESHLRLLEMLTQEISENYHQVLLSAEMREKQKMQYELSVTARMQSDILPKEFPSDGLLDIAATSIPATTVGGDFYDYMPLDNGSYGLLIADVSGKGVSAGLFMAISRSILRVHFLETGDPHRSFEKSNNHIFRDSKTGVFVTAFAVRIDTRAKELIYSSAGHFEQYLIRRGGKVVPLHTPNKPLGVVPDAGYVNKRIGYVKGDILLLYTDGITECLNEREQQYGEERLEKLLTSFKHESAREIADAVLKDVSHFQGAAVQFDDITLVAVRL